MSSTVKILSVAGIFALSVIVSFSYFIDNTKLANTNSHSPEILLHSYAPLSKIKSKAIAASCGFTIHGSEDEYTNCNFTCPSGNIITGRSQCGGVCTENPSSLCPVCNNGAVDPPACSQCGAGATWNGTGCTCNNRAINPPACNVCPSGLLYTNNTCLCANGAINPSTCNVCPVGSTMTGGNCVCNNNADIFQQCNACRSGQVFDNNGICRDACNTTNVCGQSKQGYISGGQCILATANGEEPNAGCIANFKVTTDTVNPNGSIEFNWSLSNLPSNVSATCSFVDLTTPTPRPILGLQNLDPTTDKVRINNIQSTTRFCLVCKFYDIFNSNAYLGEAAKHQWVRVIRIGEN